MTLTKETRTEIREIKELFVVDNIDYKDSQIVFSKSKIATLDKLFPGGSEVKELPVPDESPEGSSCYQVTVPKTFYSKNSQSVNVLVYPVLAVY